MSFFRAHRRLCLVWGLLWSLVVLSASSGFCIPRAAPQAHVQAAGATAISPSHAHTSASPMGAMPANCPCCHGKGMGLMQCCLAMAHGAPMKCMCVSPAPDSAIVAMLTSQEGWPPVALPAQIYTPRFSSLSLTISRRLDAVIQRPVSPPEKPPCRAAFLGSSHNTAILSEITRSFFSCILSHDSVVSR